MNDQRTFCVWLKLNTGADALLHSFTEQPSRLVWNWFCCLREAFPEYEWRLSTLPPMDKAPIGIPPWATIRRALRSWRGKVVRVAD